MPSLDQVPLSETERRSLLMLAREAIRYGLEGGRTFSVRPEDHPERLREKRATFVTLHRQGQLRGCIGHLEAVQSLVEDVAGNAWSAAFHDPRFPPLTASELSGLVIHISVLTPPRPMAFTSEPDLLRQIRPGVDGLILQDGWARGTFLPSVWDSLPRIEDFWTQLKHKAGLSAHHWSKGIKVFRYETESFGEQ